MRIAILATLSLILALGGRAADTLPQPFVAEGRYRFHPHEKMLSTAVAESDIVFQGRSVSIDLSGYDSQKGSGTYSGEVAVTSSLKGQLSTSPLRLRWEPSATGLKAGSKHIFFLRRDGEHFKVLKEIFVHELPHPCCRTYWAYDGGTDSTLHAIRLLIDPKLPDRLFAQSLESDVRTDRVHQQATAVMLACETLRPASLPAMLYAVENHTEDFVHAVYAACQLDGQKGAQSALEHLSASVHHPACLAFDAIAAAKAPKSVSVLEAFGDTHPEHRVSCAFAIREIDPKTLTATIARWKSDGKNTGLTHGFELQNRWIRQTATVDQLLDLALAGGTVFKDALLK